jgi:pullulanase
MKKIVLLGLAAFMMFTEMKAQPTVFNEMNYVTGASTVEFSLKAPPGNPVTLRLYGRADAVDPIKSIPLFYDAQRDEWWGKVEGSLEGMYYAFEAGRGETPGLLAKAVSVNGKRGAIIDLAKTNPVG